MIKNRDTKFCDNSQDTKNLIEQIETVMYGHNYEVHLWIIKLEWSTNLDSFIWELKNTLNDIKPGEYPIKEASIDILFEGIQHGFDYRWDDWAGLELTSEKEKLLSELSEKYIWLIRNFIRENTKIYFYPSSAWIPWYPVFWDYRFIVINEQDWYFIYWSSSD